MQSFASEGMRVIGIAYREDFGANVEAPPAPAPATVPAPASESPALPSPEPQAVDFPSIALPSEPTRPRAPSAPPPAAAAGPLPSRPPPKRRPSARSRLHPLSFRGLVLNPLAGLGWESLAAAAAPSPPPAQQVALPHAGEQAAPVDLVTLLLPPVTDSVTLGPYTVTLQHPSGGATAGGVLGERDSCHYVAPLPLPSRPPQLHSLVDVATAIAEGTTGAEREREELDRIAPGSPRLVVGAKDVAHGTSPSALQKEEKPTVLGEEGCEEPLQHPVPRREWAFVGLLPLMDPQRPESKQTIEKVCQIPLCHEE